MTVTKQQQLEWLASKIVKWPAYGEKIPVSVDDAGNPKFYMPWDTMRVDCTREEWQLERDKMQKQAAQPVHDKSWHQRGELPTVGCECEIKHKRWGEFQRVTVAAITKEYAIVEDDSVVAREQHYNLCDVTFRPLRTEREKAIDEMIAAIDHIKEGNFETFIGALYDAGYLKVKP